MAIAEAAIWEMRAGSSDTNGGFFIPGVVGTIDYSQQASPQVSVTDAVTNGTSTVTSASGLFTSAMVNNGVTLNEGGTTRWFQVITFTNSTTIVLDRATAGTGSGQTLKLGGAIGMTNGGFRFRSFANTNNKVWMNGAYSVTGSSPLWDKAGTVLKPITIEGYGSVRGDGGRATITRTANNIDCLTITVDNIIVKNLKLDQGINFNNCLGLSGNRCVIENCWMLASDTDGNGSVRLNISGTNNKIKRCILDSNNKGGQPVNVSASGNTFEHCVMCGSHEESGVALTSGPTWFDHCIIRNNALDGINYTGPGGVYLRFNDIWKNARDAVRLVSSGSGLANVVIEGNIIGRSTAYDINYNPADISADQGVIEWASVNIAGNAFYTAGTAQRRNLPPGSDSLVLTQNPFVDDTTLFNFDINTTAGGGADIIASPVSVAYPDNVNTGTYRRGALGSVAASVPSAPSGLVASAVGPTQINLAWTDTSSNEDGFKIERRISPSGSFALLATVGANVVAYVDTTVSPGTAYGYRVQSYSSAGGSAYSAEAIATTPLIAVGVVSAPTIDEVQLPTLYSRGAVGGPVFSTIVIETGSGAEQRVGQWQRGKRRWEISMEERSAIEAKVLYDFWKARQGKLRGFRFKDWNEYVATDELLAPLGGPSVQLRTSSVSGLVTYVQPILKPVAGSVTMKRNGSSFTAFTLDTTTGIATLTADNSKAITAITKASSAVVTVGPAHGYSIGNYVYFVGVVGMTQINGMIGTITATAATTVTVNIDSTGFSTYTSGGTLSSYIGPTETLTWSGQFDWPVRFDTDQMRLVQQDVDYRDWGSVPIVELTSGA